MKKIRLVMMAAILITALSACSTNPNSSIFNGSRTGNDSQFIMTYTAFNTNDFQVLDVKADDTIHAEIVVKSGRLSYEVQRDSDAQIIASDTLSASETFDVKAEKSGTYTVTVTGEKAKGSVRFAVNESGIE